MALASVSGVIVFCMRRARSSHRARAPWAGHGSVPSSRRAGPFFLSLIVTAYSEPRLASRRRSSRPHGTRRRHPFSLAGAPTCFDTWRVVIIVLGITMPEQRQPSRLSDRALAVLAGLVRSQRIAPMLPGSANTARGFLRLDRAAGGFFWIALDGKQLRRGAGDPAEAESLSDSFIDAMVRLGAPRQSTLEIQAPSPQSSLAKICA
jgi:hypothetical protein